MVVFFSTAYNDLLAYARLIARSYAGGNGS
jgi:hypothetical protein